MCYDFNMSITFANTLKLVHALLRGIASDEQIDPQVHAEHFQGLIFDWGGEYLYDQDFSGEVTLEGDVIMVVHWEDDGVSFDEHHEHPDTLNVIRVALQTLQNIQEGNYLPDDDTDDDPADWDDWV